MHKNIFSICLNSYTLIHMKLNHKVIALSCKTELLYNNNNKTSILTNLLYFLIFLKNNNFVLSKVFSNDNLHHLNIFFSKYKFIFFYINHINLNYLSPTELTYQYSFINTKITQNTFKKNFLKRLKKKFKKIDNFPWRLKHFVLKKLVRLKIKNSFFLVKNVSKKSSLAAYIRKYFISLNTFFSKKVLTKNSFNYKQQHNITYNIKLHNCNFSKLPIISTYFNHDFIQRNNSNNVGFYIDLFKRVSSFSFLQKLEASSKLYLNTFKITTSQVDLMFNQKFFNSTSVVFFKKSQLLNSKIATDKMIFSKSNLNKNFFFIKDLLLHPSSTSFLNHFFFTNNSFKIKNHNSTYNNYFPLTSLDFFTKNFVVKKFKESSQPIFYKYIYHYLTSFLESFFKKRVFLKIKTKVTLDESTQRELINIFAKHRSYQSKVGRGFFFFEMLEILLISFLYKDVNLLIDWFVKTMERIQFRSHKKFISTFKFILVNYQDLFVYSNSVRGFFFDIRGKVGVAGNAKKRHFSFNVGKFSKTTKASKIEYQQQIVRTFTGALGVTMIMYF